MENETRFTFRREKYRFFYTYHVWHVEVWKPSIWLPAYNRFSINPAWVNVLNIEGVKNPGLGRVKAALKRL